MASTKYPHQRDHAIQAELRPGEFESVLVRIPALLPRVIATTIREFGHGRRLGQRPVDELPEQFSHRNVELRRPDLESPVDVAA